MNPDDEPFTKALKAAVGSDVASRYTDPQLHLFLQEAVALDPRTKSKPYVDDATSDIVAEKAMEAAIRKPAAIKQEPGLTAGNQLLLLDCILYRP